MSIPLVPNLLRAHLAELAAEDKRHDGRGQFQGLSLIHISEPTRPY